MKFEFIREDDGWPADEQLSALLEHALSPLRTLTKDADSLTCVFSNDAAVQNLNRDFRGKDSPTNVLSFPDGDTSPDGIRHLGDIVLALETIRREAENEGKTFDNHLIHLIIHGCLHLLGYDHLDETQAAEMETLEIGFLQKIGIGNPYQDT